MDDETDPDLFNSNGSDHHPITIRLGIQASAPPVKEPGRNRETSLGCPKWECGDNSSYKKKLTSLLSEDCFTNVSTNIGIEYQVQDVTDALVSAVNETIPWTKLIPHKKNRLPPDVLAISKQLKTVYWQ